MKSTFSLIRQVSLLTRLKLSLSVAFSALVSYYVAAENLSAKPFYLFFGVFMLASGASALNQIQERKYDAKMLRTNLRPIPNGTLSLTSSWLIAFIFLIFGLGTLLIIGSIVSLIFGLVSLIWYNILYTGLKRITAFAVAPGTLTGVIPIMIAWEVAGGDFFNQRFQYICIFMVLWQLPHFILLTLRFRDDYKKAGFPTLTDIYSMKTVKIIILSGVLALIYTGITMAKTNLFHFAAIKIIVVIISAVFIIIFIYDLYKKLSDFRLAFISINIYMLLIMILMLMDTLAGQQI